MILQHWFIVDQTFKVSIPEQHDSAPRIYNSKWLSWFHSCATDLCCSESSDFSCVMCGWMRSAFLLCCHGSMNLTNQHTSLWGSGKLWSSLILSTSTTAQAHGCKWYMSLTDAVAPCLLVHWQATTTYRSKQWHRALFAGTSLYQVTCKIISLFSVLKRDPYMLVLDPWTEMGLIQTKKKR